MKFSRIIPGLVKSKLFGTPFYCHFYVTLRCNLRCGSCNIWKHEPIESELGLDEITEAASKIKKLGLTNVVLTGGEPFLRNDLPDIIRIFSRKGFSVRLQTNGLLCTEKRLDDVISAGVDDLTVSLDSLDKKKQDLICNSRGGIVWDKAVYTLRLSSEKLRESMTLANTVVSPHNIGELPSLVEFVDDMGVYSSLVPVNLARSSVDVPNALVRGYSSDLVFSEKDKEIAEEVYGRLLEMKDAGYKIISSRRFLKDSLHYIKTGELKWDCDAGSLYFIVLPDGSVSPCDDLNPDLNILDEYFLDNLKSREYKMKSRERARKCFGCIYGCWREVSYLVQDNHVILERARTYLKNLLQSRQNTAVFKPQMNA